jgi:hypothetical protein
MEHVDTTALLDVAKRDAATIQRMPTMMALDFLSDIGAMNENVRTALIASRPRRSRSPRVGLNVTI